MTISGDVLVHRVAGILNEQGKPPHDSTILGAISKLSWYEMEHICEFDRASKSAESPGTVSGVPAANTASPKLPTLEECFMEASKYFTSGELSMNYGYVVQKVYEFIERQLRAGA